MTTNTPNLNLVTYNGITDGSALFATFADDISGSMPAQNLGIIDNFAGAVSASLTGLSASMIEVSASITSSIFVDATIATTAEITAGSESKALVSASGLAHSDYGKRTVCIPLNTSASLTTSDKNGVRIPATMNGWILVGVDATCSGSPYPGFAGSGSPTFAVLRISASSPATEYQFMTSTGVSIDEGEYDSSTAKVAPIISTSASNVRTGDKAVVVCTTSGSSVTYAQVALTFQNLP